MSSKLRERKTHGINGYPLSRDLNPILTPIEELSILGREVRKHPKTQIRKLTRSVSEFGFVLPLLADAKGRIIHGAALLLAAKELDLKEVPVIRIDDLSEPKARALRLALNRISQESSWDDVELQVELDEILTLDPSIELELTGFDIGEIDLIIDGTGVDEEDEFALEPAGTKAIASLGEVWALGEHLLVCGNALDPKAYGALLGNKLADMVITDPPYNVPIDGHVSGLGKMKHKDFAMASGEMSSAEFETFLYTALKLAADHAVDGSLHYCFMDWRHMPEVLAAGGRVFGDLKNLCVWNKTNAGMGSLYRSQHELVFLWKKGTATHVNNVMLGRHGRHRTNVWTYASQNSMGGDKGKLGIHPTAKPVAMIADAIRDATKRGGIVLDLFGGVGTTLIAAEKTGRRARLIEIEPAYVDLTIRRWERLTGGNATRLSPASGALSA